MNLRRFNRRIRGQVSLASMQARNDRLRHGLLQNAFVVGRHAGAPEHVDSIHTCTVKGVSSPLQNSSNMVLLTA